MTPDDETDSRILIIDDQPANVVLVRRLLQHAGYHQVRWLMDSRTALRECSEWDPDLIVLDLHMPHLDGIALLTAIRAVHRLGDFVPVLVLTADITRSSLTSALAAGANDYALKPIESVELLLRVRNLLSIRLAHEGVKRRNSALAARIRELSRGSEARRDRHAGIHARVRGVLDRGGPDIHVQPIVALDSGRIVGHEALSRFPAADVRGPASWFADALEVGLDTELEIASFTTALSLLNELPEDQFLAVNVSPAVLLSAAFSNFGRKAPPGRVVVELTEHQPVADYSSLRSETNALQELGLRIAIDDAGAGYANMKHILKLAPDFIKLDIELTRDIDRDPVKAALTGALTDFANRIGASIIAEGIETRAELDKLRELGIPYGQGYYLGRPKASLQTANRATARTA